MSRISKSFVVPDIPKCKMKVAVFLLSVLVAAQASSTVQRVGSNGVAASLGENPWVVHIRKAVTTSGYLQSCVGSIIDERWVLTTASCTLNARFIWVRFGLIRVPNPELVIETGTTIPHPNWNPVTGANNIGLIGINRVVHTTANIVPVRIATGDLPSSATNFCSFGAVESLSGSFIQQNPGEELRCVNVDLAVQDDLIVATSTQGQGSQFDDGAPLVVNNEQVGILISWPSASGNIAGVFIQPGLYISWLEETTGVTLAEPTNTGESVNVVDP